jgi:hypothetical protein
VSGVDTRGQASVLGRGDLERLLLADDPSQSIRDAIADGSLDRLIPEIRQEMDVPQRTHYTSTPC